jgi:hypothetical protein
MSDDLKARIDGLIGPSLKEFSRAIGKGEQQVRRYVKEGMPTLCIGRTRRAIIPDSVDWLIARGQPRDYSQMAHRGSRRPSTARKT